MTINYLAQMGIGAGVRSRFANGVNTRRTSRCCGLANSVSSTPSIQKPPHIRVFRLTFPMKNRGSLVSSSSGHKPIINSEVRIGWWATIPSPTSEMSLVSTNITSSTHGLPSSQGQINVGMHRLYRLSVRSSSDGEIKLGEVRSQIRAKCPFTSEVFFLAANENIVVPLIFEALSGSASESVCHKPTS